MEITTVGKVVVPARIQNLKDLHQVEMGLRSADQARTVAVDDAIVDTGASMLSMPKRLIDALGLERVRTRRARTALGVSDFGVYSLVRLAVQGRDCPMEVVELPDECPVLIGQLPLEHMDWVVDPVGQRLIGNPAHGGEEMIDLF